MMFVTLILWRHCLACKAMCLEAAVAALRQNFVTETGSPQWETLDALVSQAEASDNRTAGHAHGGAEANSASSSNANYAEVLQRVLASPQGSALRRVFADLDAQQLLQGLAGKKGRPLRDLASNGFVFHFAFLGVHVHVHVLHSLQQFELRWPQPPRLPRLPPLRLRLPRRTNDDNVRDERNP